MCIRDSLGSWVQGEVLHGVEGGEYMTIPVLRKDLIVLLREDQSAGLIEQTVQREPDLLARGIHFLQEEHASMTHGRCDQSVLEPYVSPARRQQLTDDVVGRGQTVQIHAVERGVEQPG